MVIVVMDLWSSSLSSSSSKYKWECHHSCLNLEPLLGARHSGERSFWQFHEVPCALSLAMIILLVFVRKDR